jgi:hypothetical protein
MTKIAFLLTLLVAVLVCLLPAVQAQAQSIRTFVSTAGSDSNPCSITQPCRHFQAAVNATTSGGEVDALDAGAYGSFTISNAITIEGQGWSYIAPGANGNAITVNAGSGNVSIHGVSLNGAGITGGTNGIVFNAGGSLAVTDCVAQNFAGNGILIQPTSGPISFTITNTVVSNNSTGGINYQPSSGSATAAGVIDHVVATNNQVGIDINMEFHGGSTTVAISNSIVSLNNGGDGGIFIGNEFFTQPPTAALAVSIDNTSITGNVGTGNDGYGIWAEGTSKVTLGRSVITANGNGIINDTSPNTFYSYQDNRINLNATNDAVPLISLTLH